jgi:hypothetical protein
MANVTLDIPDDVLVKLKKGAGQPDKALRLAAAFSLCRPGRVVHESGRPLSRTGLRRFS